MRMIVSNYVSVPEEVAVTAVDTTVPETDETLAGIRIIDCDAHITEPANLWISRAPAAMRDRIPVQKTVDGITAWYLHDQLWASTGGNTISTGGGRSSARTWCSHSTWWTCRRGRPASGSS